jgi:charged multivesicular body protein 5
VLQQKKLYEGQLSQLQQQTFNMESAALTTDNLRNTMATVDAMKLANKELRKQYGKIDIDKIEVCLVFSCTINGSMDFSQNMHYDMEELIEQANEIQESLGRSYAVPDEIDEADLEAGTICITFFFIQVCVKRQNCCRTGCPTI